MTRNHLVVFADALDDVHAKDCAGRPNCDGALSFSVACHAGAGLTATYGDGALHLACSRCGAACADIAVASSTDASWTCRRAARR